MLVPVCAICLLSRVLFQEWRQSPHHRATFSCWICRSPETGRARPVWVSWFFRSLLYFSFKKIKIDLKTRITLTKRKFCIQTRSVEEWRSSYCKWQFSSSKCRKRGFLFWLLFLRRALSLRESLYQAEFRSSTVDPSFWPDADWRICRRAWKSFCLWCRWP